LHITVVCFVNFIQIETKANDEVRCASSLTFSHASHYEALKKHSKSELCVSNNDVQVHFIFRISARKIYLHLINSVAEHCTYLITAAHITARLFFCYFNRFYTRLTIAGSKPQKKIQVKVAHRRHARWSGCS